MPFRLIHRIMFEALEDRTMLDSAFGSTTPSIVVGRTLSSYTVSGIQNHQETITYTVYNEQATAETGVLLTTTLEPGVTYASASVTPDQSGQNLAWSLGTIEGDDRASVSLTVTLANNTPLQLDSGAKAYAILNANSASNTTPAATLSTMTVAPGTLDSTPDANTTDPYIQEEAAELDYNPQNIFNYLHTQVGYNAYTGSVRGARGTLWSDAGNALDVASLGVALMRASGIPAQYVSGTLTLNQAEGLILSMFPASTQTVGYIPAGTTVSHPATDSRLISETESHYWFQFNTGTGFQSADPLMASATIGQTFASSTGTFTDVDQSLRATTEVQLQAEIYSQAEALFGLSGLTTTTVLDHTFNDVDLVGRPLTVGNFASSSEAGFLFTAQTNTYSPYLLVQDEALPASEQPEPIMGQSYQEVVTNFPLGSEILTGLFLNLSLAGPGTTTEDFSKTLVDRLGYATRQGLAPVNLSISPTSTPIITSDDLTTLNILSSLQNLNATQLVQRHAAQQIAMASQTGATSVSQTAALTTFADAELANFASGSNREAANLAKGFSVAAYLDSPTITAFSSNVAISNGQGTLSYSLDLVKDSVKVIAAPGQNARASQAFAMAKGMFDSFLEAQLLPTPAGVVNLSSSLIVQQAIQQGIPLVTISSSNLLVLQSLNLPSDAIARITANVQDGLTVIVPSRTVTIDGKQEIAWYNFNPTTGETIAESEDGEHQGLIEFIYSEELGIAGVAIQIPELASIILTGPILGVKAAKVGLATFVGYTGNILTSNPILFFLNGLLASVLAILAFTDPPVQPIETDLDLPYPDVPLGSAILTTDLKSNAATGGMSASIRTTSIKASGDLEASWKSSSTDGFGVSSVVANVATVVGAEGKTVGSGSVALSASSVVLAAISGNNAYSVNGSGSLSFYGPAESSLGVSGEWSSYTATVTGNVSITLTTAGLVLNGMTLPAGTYTITTNSATLMGSGNTSSPNFSGSVAVSASNGTVNLGRGTGSVSVGNSSVSEDQGLTLTGYSGIIGVSANGDGTDSVSLSGSTGNVLSVSASPSSLSANQNTPVSFTPLVSTSFADSYSITALAPVGWSVAIDASGKVTVTPAAGTQSGTYPIDVTVQSSTNSDLVAQSIVEVTVAPTAPGISFSVASDSQFTVPYNGAQIPSAFRASIQNIGPAADTYNLTFSNVPSGFTLANSRTSVTLPAGQKGIIGLYLIPVAGSSLPAPGTVLTFQVTATSTTAASITKTQTVRFTVPTIDAVTLSSSQSSLNVTPGVSVPDTITITNVGNVAETNITLTATTSSGLSLTGLAPVTLGVGQSMTETVMVTPSASTPLNSILQAIFTATYGASAASQTLTLPVDVVVPGAQAIGNASNAATQLGDTDLANRLGDLSMAITNLVKSPISSVYRSQSVGDVNAVAGLIGDDPILVFLAPALKADCVTLSQATTANAVQSALSQLSNDLSTLNTTLNDELGHNFTLSLVGNSQVAQPQTPVSFQIVLQNTGRATTTYDLAIAGLPSGVTAQFSQTSITLGAGQVTPGTGEPSVTVTLTSTSSTVVPVFSFQISATAEGAAELTRTTTGSLTSRAALVSVVSVTTNPPFTEPGGSVDVSTRILNAVNEQQTALVSFVVKNSGGTTLYTSTHVTTTLNVITSLSTVDLGSFSTTGFADGIDTITVVVTTPSGMPIPGANATGSLQVGSPVTATNSVNPDNLPIGSGTVNNSITVALDANNIAPLNLLGQIQPSGGTNGVALVGTLAYVSSSAGINIIDVSNPENPTVVGSFASGDLTSGDRFTTVRVMGNDLVVEESVINGGPINGGPPYRVLVYSLANPLAPTLLGQTNIDNLNILGDFILDDNHVYVDASWIRYYLADDQIFQQFGEIATVDLTDPANPVDTGIAYNLPPDPNSGYPDGDSLIFGMTPFDSSTLLAGSTTATMATTNGTGEILSVDTSDPSNPAVVSTLQVPGTAYILATAKESGNRLLAIGSTGPFAAVNTATSDFGPSGTLVLITLDDTDPRNLKILSTQDLSRASRGYQPNLLPIGGDRFLFNSAGSITDEPEVLLIDASGSGDAVVSAITVPSAVTNSTVVGNDLYTVSASGLLIYNIGSSSSETPVAVKVEVPNNTGVSIVPGSFNIAPTSITTGTDFDTIEWDLELDPATSSRTFTYQTLMTGLQAGESRPVTDGTAVNFTSQGTAGTISLAPLTVAGQQFLSLIGMSGTQDTTQPGQAAGYEMKVSNPTGAGVTYNLTIAGLPAGWSQLPGTVTVAAGQTTDLHFTLTPDATTVLGTYGFVITAAAGDGTAGSVVGSLVVQGVPVEPDTQSHGIVATLTPVEATAGQGTSGQYILRLTNTGSADDTFSLQLEPSTFTDALSAVFGETTIDIPPGASNFREIPLTLTPRVGTSVGSGSFTVMVQSTTNSSVSTTTSGILDVVAYGVTESLNQSSIAPGGTLELTVTNTGSVADTFDLSLGGPAALVSTLGSTKVKLAPGASEVVPITTTAVNFAVQGALGLTAIATSEANSAVKANASSSLAIPATVGMTAQLTPATQLLPIPGTTSFLLIVHNTGNTEDSYSATLMGINGPIQAKLIGLDGSPADSIPIFRLPGLSTAEIVLQADLTGVGQGTVSVQTQSSTNATESSTATASVTSTPATSLQLTSSATQTTIGQPVTFTAVVSSASSSLIPTGSVIFTIDGVAQAPMALSLIGGKDEATLTTSTLRAGMHQVSAAFSGTDFGSSSAGPVSIEVNQVTVNPLVPSSLLLSGPSVPVAFGQAVTIIATLKTASGAPTPTGSVVFDVDGTENLSIPIQVNNGVAQAVLVLNGLTAGLHAVLATYAGDAAVAASVSPVLLATVNSPIVFTPPVIDGPQVINVQRYGYHSLPNSFVLTFDEALDPSRAQNIANYRIVGPGGVVEPLKSAIYDPGTMTVTLYPRKSLDLHAIYRLTIVGTGTSGVADLSGNLLDGARTGVSGSNYISLLEASQLVLGEPVPGGPAQLVKLRRELAQIESNQAKELAKQEASARKANSKKNHVVATKKVDRPVAKSPVKSGKRK